MAAGAHLVNFLCSTQLWHGNHTGRTVSGDFKAPNVTNRFYVTWSLCLTALYPSPPPDARCHANPFIVTPTLQSLNVIVHLQMLSQELIICSLKKTKYNIFSSSSMCHCTGHPMLHLLWPHLFLSHNQLPSLGVLMSSHVSALSRRVSLQ